MPFRIFKSKNRAAAFAVMMIVPAAMFAMFFFLSLFIQQVVGYSPLHTGVAFLPFSIAMIISATAASKLISHVDPRYLSGVGTLLSAAALYGFSRITVPEDPASILGSLPASMGGQGVPIGDGVNYWTQILPFIVLMAFGMGLNFVPLTLVAVHHLRAQDTGIGSGVLNTMQQVGGALGLATLSTVSLHFAQTRADEIAPSIAAAAPGMDPSAPRPAGQPRRLHRGRDDGLLRRLDHDAGGLGHRVDLPRRQARGARHGERPPRASTSADRRTDPRPVRAPWAGRCRSIRCHGRPPHPSDPARRLEGVP